MLLLSSALVASLIYAPFARAAIVYQSSGTGSNGTGAAELEVAWPTGVQAGDLLIATVAKRSAGAFNTPANWTLLSSVTSADSTVTQAVFYRVIAPGDGIGVTQFFYFSGSAKATGGISRYSGVNTAAPINASGSMTASGPFNGNFSQPNVTTTVANTYVINSISQANSATFSHNSIPLRYQITSSGGGRGDTKITTGAIDQLQPTPATTSGPGMQTSVSGSYVAHTIAIAPAPPATLAQQTFRWFTNVDATNFSSVQSNPTTGSDANYAATNDASFLYTTGYTGSNGNDWRIEKRNLTDGALVSGFGTGGALDVNVSANDDRAWGIDQDASNLYVVGQDASISNTNTQWRIEKRDKTTGGLVSGFGTNGVVQNNPTTGIDTPKEVKVDDTHVYIAGFDNTGLGAWRIEKRDKTTGALVSGFGTNGAVVTDYEPTENDEIAAMVIDTNNIYVGGYDYSSGSTLNSQSRIEKRDKTTGALVSGFGTNGAVVENPFTGNSSSTIDDGIVHKGLLINGTSLYAAASEGVTGSTDFQWRITKRDLTSGALDTNFGTNGVVNVNPSTAIDNPTSIRTDGTALFIGGFDRSQDGGQSRWRIERRDMATGAEMPFALFGSGVYVSNPSTGHDELRDLVVAGNNIYGVGYDLIPGNYQMHIQKMSRTNSLFASEDSTPRAAQGAAATAVALNEKIRLRLLLKASAGTLAIGEKQFKLQFAQQSGACDTSFVGESYTDVTTTSAIAFWNNTALTDGTALNLNISDPIDGVAPTTYHTYEEANNFTTTADIPDGSNGMWDLSLYNRSSADGVTYCFRVVESTGATLTSYTVVPSLTTGAVSSVGQSNYRWLQNANGTAPGTALAAQNTATSIATGTPFRLRQLLNQISGTTTAATSYKLQSGEKVSTCSAATYVDVGSPMGFFNNATPADDATISSTANDPTPVSGSVVYQTYNENGAFANPTQITSGNNGLWDFSLTSEAGAAGKTYCFRVVTSAGSQLTSYSQYPEITFTSSGASLGQQLRGGQSVINGTKTPITF